MRKHISITESLISIEVDGQSILVAQTDSVAAALLGAGIVAHRASVSGAPRGPFCMMGVCFECLVEIEGFGRKQGCMTPVAAGMKITTQTKRCSS